MELENIGRCLRLSQEREELIVCRNALKTEIINTDVSANGTLIFKLTNFHNGEDYYNSKYSARIVDILIEMVNDKIETIEAEIKTL